ncbi:MAG: hypothetical protein KJO59_11520, partial [Ignavibacteria bacterium]|nr:hypothetical protein [Ignavibacteria bacterium]
MKNLSLIFISFLLIQLNTFAQEWYEQTTGVTTELLSVSAELWSDKVVWACGDSGTIIKTTDGGITWTDVSGNGVPTILTLHSIACRSADLAMVTGAKSSGSPVYKTTDGGNTWIETFFANGGYIYDIVFTTAGNFGLQCNPIDGYWRVWWSTNNGDNWEVLSTYPQEGSETGWNNAVCVVYPLGRHGTNNSRIYSSPTGYVWSPQPTPGLTNSKAIWFISYDVGMVGGDGMVFTTDGGSNWKLISVPGTGDILGITSVLNNWWFVRGSSIYQSTDDG